MYTKFPIRSQGVKIANGCERKINSNAQTECINDKDNVSLCFENKSPYLVQISNSTQLLALAFKPVCLLNVIAPHPLFYFHLSSFFEIQEELVIPPQPPALLAKRSQIPGEEL
jgi:hypothetical protein